MWLCAVALMLNAISLYLLSQSSEYLAATFVMTAGVLYLLCRCTNMEEMAIETFTYADCDMV